MTYQDPNLPDYEQRTQPNPAIEAGRTRPNTAVPPMPPESTRPHTPLSPTPPPTYYQPPPSTPTHPGRTKRRKSLRRRYRVGCVGCSPMGCLISCAGVLGVTSIVLLISLYIVYSEASARFETAEVEMDRKFAEWETSGYQTTFIYDRHGEQLYEVFGECRRQLVPLNEMSDYVLWATISTEDGEFYENSGVDLEGIARAARDYLREGEVVSGGSTITQQLVRLVVFDDEYRYEQSMQRKMDEAVLALVLTQERDKDEILELYLNTVYYGHRACGIEAASQVYFNKSASQLDLQEAALLAGLINSPNLYADVMNPDPVLRQQAIDLYAKPRQEIVLNLMVKEGYITAEQAETALLMPLNLADPEETLEIPLDKAPHFVLYAKNEANRILDNLGYEPNYLENGGLHIYTSLDMQFQQIAEYNANQNINALRTQHDVTNSAVVVIHPPSGEIMGMVGSLNYNDEAIDGKVNVALAPRQPGSTMKAFTYAAAIEQGWSPGTIIWDTEVNIGVPGQPTYSPVNYDRRYHGPVRVRTALANSYNIPAVQTLRKVGVQYLLDFMHRFGVHSLSRPASEYGLSLTLGGGEVTLLDLTNGYATFARLGNYVAPTSIVCIVDSRGNVIYQYENRCAEIPGHENWRLTESTYNTSAMPVPVLDPRIAFMISDILSDNVARTPAMGSNSPLVTRDASGNVILSSVKTGTTNDFRDNWTVGYTNDLVVGVWSGNSDNRPMRNISGLQGAAPIWRDTLQGIYTTSTYYSFPPSVLINPGGMVQRPTCRAEALRDPSTECPKVNEWFLDGAVLLPDGKGGLAPGYVPAPPQPINQEYGPQLIPIEPGIIQTYVRPLSPEQATLLVSQNNNVMGVAPKYCLMPVEILGQVPDATVQIFIEPPPDQGDYPGAYRYAYQAGIPILPLYPCTGETVISSQAPPAQAWEVNPTAAEPWRTAAIYCLPDGGIEVYSIVNGQGVYAFTAPLDLINAVGIQPNNSLIAEGAGIRLYRLNTGEFQVNAPLGGDSNGYVKVWGGCY